MMLCNSLYFALYFVGSTLVLVNSEVYTALADMENLLYTEAEIAETLEKYLELEEQKLEKVRRLSEEYKKLFKAAVADVETFLSNPVNAYLLVKHLTADWKVAESIINGSSGAEIMENTHLNNLEFPGDEDLTGAAAALMRLQDTYLLNTSILASGHIGGTALSLELTSGDCFELGRQAYNNEKFFYAVLWMQEALERIENENIKTANKVDILEYMAFSTFKLNNFNHAVNLTKDILNIDPDHPRAHGNLAYYTAVAQLETQKKGDDNQIVIEHIPTLDEKPRGYQFRGFNEYERLCRGEKLKTPEEESKLKCRFITNNHPFLLLQPAKEEELSLDPRIVVYHDVLSDREIDVIKFLATPKLKRAKVRGGDIDGKSGFATYRISKSAWLENEDHEVLERFSQRIEAITGLTTDTAEDLQVVNYGIGGHYEPHLDFAQKHEREEFVKDVGTGNRIATWINYMSDVDAGGATVFPIIGVQVKPIKGSAAFWYNLFLNGDGDMETEHAACPVLAGSKWVSNKWFCERGQEFRRPCSLDPDE